MTLEEWLRENFISTEDFARRVGVSSNTLRRIKRGEPVSAKVSFIIEHLTDGKVRPLSSDGRGSYMKRLHGKL